MHELRSLLPFLRPYLRTYALGLALVVISNFFATLGPPVPGARDRRAPCAGIVPRGADRRGPAARPWPWLGGVARYGMRELLNSGSRRVETDLRDQLYQHLQRMSAEFYDRYPTGDVMARTTNDLLAVRMVAGPALMYLVDTSIRTLLIAPAMVAISPRLTLLAFLPLLGLPVIMVSPRRAWSTAGPRPSRPTSATSPATRTRTSPVSGWSGRTARRTRRSPTSADSATSTCGGT